MSYGARADISTPSFPPQTRLGSSAMVSLASREPRRSPDARCSRRGDSRIFGGWVVERVEEMNRSTKKICILFFYGVPRRDCAARNVFFPRIPVFGEIFGFAKSGHGNRDEIGCNRMLDPDKKRNFQRDTVMRAKHRGFLSTPPSLPIMFRASIPFDSS